MNSQNRYALETRAQFIALRLLVEAVISAVPQNLQLDVCAAFHAGSEAAVASLLAHATRDTTVQAVQAAVEDQRQRLVLHLELPGWPLPEG